MFLKAIVCHAEALTQGIPIAEMKDGKSLHRFLSVKAQCTRRADHGSKLL